MYLRVSVVRHWIDQIIFDDVRRQVAGTFSGFRDDGFQVDLEVEEADYWGAGVAVVCDFFATNC